MDEHRPTEQHLLHFAFGARRFAKHDLTLHVGERAYSLERHSPRTRTKATADNPFVGLLSESGMSHFTEATLPRDAITSMLITRPVVVDGHETDAIVALAIHVPREGRRKELQSEVQSGLKAGRRVKVTALHPKLAWHTKKHPLLKSGRAMPKAMLKAMLKLAADEPDLLHDILDPFETAASLLYHHPSLINLSTENDGEIPQTILRACIGLALQERSLLVDRIDELGVKWSRPVPLMDDGKPVLDSAGAPFFALEVHDKVKRALADPMHLALQLARQNAKLEGHNWTLRYGQTVVEVPPSKARRKLLRADQTKWKMKSLTSLWGVEFDRVEYTEPTDGGLSIGGIWSKDDPTSPMPADFIADFIAGRAVVVGDMPDKAGAWRVEVPATTVAAGDPVVHTFTFSLPDRRVGKLRLGLNGLRTDLTVDAESLIALPSKVHVGARRGEKDVMLWSCKAPAKRFGEIRVTARNNALRHLSAYAEFFNANGDAIDPIIDLAWTPPPIRALFDTHKTKRYVDVIPPVDMIFGIPLSADWLTLKIPFPEEATTMRLYWGGIGTGAFNPTVCAAGTTATVVFEMALPTMLLLIGVAEYNTGTINKILADKDVLYPVLVAMGVAIAGGSGGYIGMSQDPARAATTVAIKLAPALAKLGLQQLTKYLIQKQGEAFAKKWLPLANLAFLAFDTSVTIMQLIKTTSDLAQSPALYDIEITRTFDLRVKINPDPTIGRFPDYHDQMRVLVMHDSGATLTASTLNPPSGPISKPIDWSYDECASGGRIKVMVFFYAANHWQSGMGSSEWVDARGADGTLVRTVQVQIKNELIPLTKDSVYQHRDVLVFESGKHAWQTTGAPTETFATRSFDPKRQLVSLGGITVAQRPGAIGYAWQATGLGLPPDKKTASRTNDALYVVQNISAFEDPSSREAMSPVGFTARTAIAYDLTCANDGSGMSFYLDPSRGEYDYDKNREGGTHLRRIALSSDNTPVFEPGSRQSWGRFPRPVHSFVHHTQGWVAAIIEEFDKILLLKIGDTAVDDAQAPLCSLLSGQGERNGLLSRPRAIAVALDGRLLVLEDGNKRIQSFNLGGNPVPYFDSVNGKKTSPTMALKDTGKATTYLDLSVEAKGYLFVLAHDGDGRAAAQYHVDIYEPNGAYLVSTPGVAAGKIAVDLARAMYTLNWQTLKGPSGRAEPSISQWLAPPPSVAGRPPAKRQKRGKRS